MKNKWWTVLALGLALSSLTACGGETDSRTPGGSYKNGDYQAEWADFNGDGWKDQLVLRVDRDGLEVVEFDAVGADGSLISKSSEAKAAMQAANEAANLPVLTPSQAHAAAMQSFKAAGGKVEDMELVAGATQSCYSLQMLVKEVLSTTALTGETDTATVALFLDGNYAVSQPDFAQDGWKCHLTLTVSGGKATVAEFDGVNAEGALRSTTEVETFASRATALMDSYTAGGKVTDAICPDEATTALFQQLLTRGLENAQFRGPTEDTLPILANGVYRAEMSTSENGWTDYLVLAVSRDQIMVQEFDGTNEAGDHKSNNAEWQEKKRDAQSYIDQIIAAYHTSGGKPAEMENVVGATLSSNNFRLMAGELLGYSIPSGDQQTLIVNPSDVVDPPISSSTPEDNTPTE